MCWWSHEAISTASMSARESTSRYDTSWRASTPNHSFAFAAAFSRRRRQGSHTAVTTAFSALACFAMPRMCAFTPRPPQPIRA